MVSIGKRTIPKVALTHTRTNPEAKRDIQIDARPDSQTTHIFFDFFGTIVEYSASRTEQGYPRSFDILRSVGSPIEYDDFLSLWSEVSAEFDDAANRTNREFSMLEVGHAFLERAGLRSSAKILDDFVSTYLKEWNKGVRPIDGFSAMLDDLDRYYSLSVITNTHDPGLVPNHLEQLGIARHFDHVIASVELGVRKPAREIFEYSLRRLETTAARSIYVGDSYEADYVGALSSGIRCLLIDPRHEAPIRSADRLDSILDLSRVMAVDVKQAGEGVCLPDGSS